MRIAMFTLRKWVGDECTYYVGYNRWLDKPYKWFEADQLVHQIKHMKYSENDDITVLFFDTDNFFYGILEIGNMRAWINKQKDK